MKVTIDTMLCEANALCVEEAPEVFELDDDDELHLLRQPDESMREAVESAVMLCPRNALTLED